MKRSMKRGNRLKNREFVWNTEYPYNTRYRWNRFLGYRLRSGAFLRINVARYIYIYTHTYRWEKTIRVDRRCIGSRRFRCKSRTWNDKERNCNLASRMCRGDRPRNTCFHTWPNDARNWYTCPAYPGNLRSSPRTVRTYCSPCLQITIHLNIIK